MSERDGYAHGVPCWVDTWRDDPTRAADFYAGVLGWEIAGLKPRAQEQYAMGQVQGRDVAGIGSPVPPAAQGQPAAWITYVWVDDADETARKAVDAGGSVLAEPFDSLDGGRMTIIADPAGATIGAWKLGEHRGAQLVNEPGAWSMSALSSSDPEGAKAFYGSVFGWETEAFGPMTMFRLPGYVGGEPSQPVPRDVIAVMESVADASPSRWNADFWIADVDAGVATALAAGGSVISAPNVFEGAPFKQAVIADPDGAAMSLSQLLVAA